MPAAKCSSDGYYSPGETSAPSLQKGTESRNALVHRYSASPPDVTRSFSALLPVLLKNLIVVNFFVVLDCFHSCVLDQSCEGGKSLDKWRSPYSEVVLVSAAVKNTWVSSHSTYKQRL